jgi:hypothetical protein
MILCYLTTVVTKGVCLGGERKCCWTTFYYIPPGSVLCLTRSPVDPEGQRFHPGYLSLSKAADRRMAIAYNTEGSLNICELSIIGWDIIQIICILLTGFSYTIFFMETYQYMGTFKSVFNF